MSLIERITENDIKKIFSNRADKKRYLELLSHNKNVDLESIRTNNDVDNAIINTWEYKISKDIIRKLFRETDKYADNRDSKNKIENLVAEWKALKLGPIEWPFSATNFDQYVHRLNRSERDEISKDIIISRDSVKFRRIKDINAYRNDYIEHLVFEGNENVIPTLKNTRGVDYYIDGNPYDQKVSRGVGKAFVEKYGAEYKKFAISNPDLVAKSLYENQDKARFGDEPRFLIVYLDEDISPEDIERSLNKSDFKTPVKIDFEYAHNEYRVESYSTYCYVALLYK